MNNVHVITRALRMVMQLLPLCAIVFIQVDSAVAGGADRDTSGYSDFVDELREYIPNNIILQLVSKLPSGGLLYGYDIGDLTGNDKPDMVISLKKPKAKWNDIFIYFFTTRDEGFDLVKVIKRQYNDEPLEVAFYIENGTCFVTDKVEDKHWRVDGYSIDKFVFRQVYHWTNHPLNKWNYGIQVESDYRKMGTTEFYYNSETMSPILKNKYITIPAYPVKMKIPRDVPYVVSDSASLMVLSGVSNWSGPDDCSLSVFARYDSTELAVSAVVYDDNVSGGGKQDARDAVSFWIDCKGSVKLSYEQGVWAMKGPYATGTLGITIAADSGKAFTRMDIRYVDLTKKEQELLQHIGSTSAMLKSGARLIRCRIPLKLLANAGKDGKYGFTVSYTDVDRLGDDVRTSHLATSQNFMEGVPYTFGLLKFIPAGRTPFERDDFRMQPLLKELTNAGVLPR